MGEVLYIEGMYQKGYKSDRYFFKTYNVKLLDTVGKEKTKSITIKVPIAEISSHFIDDLDQLCKKFRGKHKFKMLLVDSELGINLNLISSEKKVDANNEFVAELEKLGLSYKLN